MNLRLFTLLLIISAAACEPRQQKEQILTPGIYHWKSRYNPDSSRLQKLDKLGICKQYVRFFDIDINPDTGEPTPKSVIHFKKRPPEEMVPVVYITNRTFQQAGEKQIKELARNTAQKIASVATENHLTFRAVQMDCDWSKSTQQAYFEFLKQLKTELPHPVSLTATLRLHQIKFMEQTGIPPVSRATLMLYNVGDWTSPSTKNSLFDPEIIDQYVYRIPEYPLPLDIALPIYQQTLVYRNQKLYTFLKDQPFAELSRSINLKKTEAAELYICQENCKFLNRTFRKGDVFRFEEVNFRALKQVEKAVLSRISNQDIEVIFYHLDDFALEQFSEQQFRQLL